jgi:hypothetical protein
LDVHTKEVAAPWPLLGASVYIAARGQTFAGSQCKFQSQATLGGGGRRGGTRKPDRRRPQARGAAVNGAGGGVRVCSVGCLWLNADELLR